MIREIGHFHPTLGNFYITLLMVSSMGLVMLVVTWQMFQNKRLNLVLLGLFAVVFVSAFVLGRTGTFIDNEQFLHSMIPHHSRAILLCEEASLTDSEIISPCDQIIQNQRQEIAQMEQILERY
ncbi:DUF305 domain-containing protein [soil metagenome]